jgi:hypothetical protein
VKTTRTASKNAQAASSAIYVHLNSGEVLEVSPATGVRLTADELLVLNGERVVAKFARPSVYLTSDVSMERPPFN